MADWQLISLRRVISLFEAAFHLCSLLLPQLYLHLLHLLPTVRHAFHIQVHGVEEPIFIFLLLSHLVVRACLVRLTR